MEDADVAGAARMGPPRLMGRSPKPLEDGPNEPMPENASENGVGAATDGNNVFVCGAAGNRGTAKAGASGGGGPSNVCVLPLPVWPYARMVPL